MNSKYHINTYISEFVSFSWLTFNIFSFSIYEFDLIKRLLIKLFQVCRDIFMDFII